MNILYLLYYLAHKNKLNMEMDNQYIELISYKKTNYKNSSNCRLSNEYMDLNIKYSLFFKD